MMRPGFYILIISIFACVCANAQLKVDMETTEWGELAWHSERTRSVVLHNKSRHDLVLTDVRTDCGCLVPEWHKGQLLEAGQKMQLMLTYKAETLGHFRKGLQVTTQDRDGKEQTVETWISGVVEPFVVDYEREFPYNVGEGVYLSADVVEFDDVQHGQVLQQTLRLANGTKQDYTPVIMHLPSWLTVESTPKVVKPGHSAVLTFTADAGQVSRYGLAQTSVYVSRHAGDKVGADNDLQVSLTLVPAVKQGDANAPRIEVDSVVVLSQSGTKRARRASGSIHMANVGKSPLEINRLQVYNTGLQVSLNRTKINPGQTATLRVSGWAESENNSKGRRRILLITNDPERPKITIDVK